MTADREAMTLDQVRDELRRMRYSEHCVVPRDTVQEWIDAIDACLRTAEPVATIESAQDRHGPYLTHANVVLSVWNGYVPKAGDRIFTYRPEPARGGAA